ncbi:NAD(P)-dependent oxidoreductase [Variovorax sp. J31P207]|uniref:NAD-dependent epimerase/dehydratase family protein n=1 Tax=Variovorax sp. J31P207 TaxID=3053510 RepID=UPI002574E250|nr:NAD(P)-dependent oxidoreductase [Variovorax sp. J31P207]MDM0069331.1 NAD(P)-dependent oxidoreductase [Variovorax sp. J31P207]
MLESRQAGMTVLITGAGLIGRETARQLRAQGMKVVLADWRGLDADTELAVRAEQVDVTDLDALSALVHRHGIEAVVHTAAVLTPGFAHDPLQGIRVNAMGAAHALELGRRFAMRRVVLAGSATVAYSAFGSLPATPIPEDFSIRVLGERPGSLYACTKLFMEHLALAYANQHGVDAVVLRFGAVLGPERGRATSVPGRMLETLLDAARSGRPASFDDTRLLWGGREEFVDVRDCARAVIAALEAPKPSQRIYSIASGEWHSFPEVVAIVRESFPSLPFEEIALPSTGISGFPFQRPAPTCIDSARDELGFIPRYGLAETVRNIAMSHREQHPHAGSR